MSNDAIRSEGVGETRPSFGADIRSASPSALPLYGAKPPGILVQIAKIVAGQARAKKKPSLPAAAGVPDPEKIFPAPRYSADGASLDSGQGAHYDLIGAELRQEAGELDVAAADKATMLGSKLAETLLDQMESSAVYGLSAVLRGLIMLGLVVFAAAFSWRVASQLSPAPYSYALLYAFIGLVGVLAAGAAADSAAGAAKKRFARISAELESLIAQATGRFHDRLNEQRNAMQLNSASDLPGALRAAAQARMTTVAGLRFFEHAPVIGAAGEGYKCHVLGEAVASVAQHRLGAGTRVIGRSAALIFGVAIGILLLFFSLAQPVSFLPMPPFLGELVAAEAARPGIVTFALAMAAAIFAPYLLGPIAAQIVAADDPTGALKRYGLDSAANGLKDRALTAAAEKPREMIERFADAMVSLEKRAEAWSKTGARFAEGAPAEDLPWRKAPDGPRFVAQTFASAPPKFVAEPAPPMRRGFFSKAARPDALPKQSFEGAETPPWLKN
ncbi:MAG: hypothetical protein U5J99_01015 [Parvularculaceae bacterium]|nr:hypothetical protein [Parvularculaceae bacterium]